MTPDEISQELVEFSVLLGSFSEKLAELEQAYVNEKLRFLSEAEISVAKAELKAQGTEAYKNYKEAKVLEKAIIETIRALKYRLRVIKDEMEGSMNI
jgi:KaiC/GvpD/RAD55 family RecA-like ATPase